MLTKNACTFPKANQMRLNLPYPYSFSNQEVALSSLYIYYSWRNINSTYANNTFSYSFNGTTRNITLPDGFYSIADISSYMQLQMYQNGDYLLDSNGLPVYYISLQSNPVYYSATLTCTPIPSVLPSGYTNPRGIALSGNTPLFIVNNSAFGTLIGFNNASYPTVTQTSVYQANSNFIPTISPVSTVSVWCSLVNDSKLQKFPQNIYTFSPSTSYTSQIQIQPQSLLFFRVLDQTVSYIDIEFRDQLGRDLPLLDNDIVCTLILQDRQR